MKLSRKVLLILVIVIFAVALGILLSIYLGQVDEQAELNDRVSRARTLLPGLINTREEREAELAHAQWLLTANQAQFPQSIESIEYGEDLFEIADDCNVAISGLTVSTPTNKTVGSITYSVSSFVVIVQGSIDNILDFIYELRTGYNFRLPWSAEVNNVQMNVAGGGAKIDLVIYGLTR